jgi:hypothetical protein
MSEENLAAVLHGPLDVRFEKISVPEPGHNGMLDLVIFLNAVVL